VSQQHRAAPPPLRRIFSGHRNRLQSSYGAAAWTATSFAATATRRHRMKSTTMDSARNAPGLRGLLIAAAISLTVVCRIGAQTPPPGCVGDGWVRGGAECLHIETYRSQALPDRPTLVVVLHGDSPFSNPQYQYQWAQRLAAEQPGIVAVGLLRPGYTDRANHRSSGVRGSTTGDNYTPDVVHAIADAVKTLRL